MQKDSFLAIATCPRRRLGSTCQYQINADKCRSCNKCKKVCKAGAISGEREKILMAELTNEAGRFRFGGVGVFAGEKLVHMAPPADVIPKLISDLIHWVKTTDTHPLIKNCVFH